MALLPRLESFIWGPNGQALTPGQVERLRAKSESRLAGAIDTSPVGHWSQGAARLVNALGGVMGERRADRAEEEGLAAADSVIAALMGQGAPSMVSAPVDAAGIPDVSVPQVPIGPHSSDPRQDVSGAFAGSAAASGQNFPMSLVQSESGGNWSALNSEGYGGRLQFGKDRLADAARAGIIPAGMTGAQFSQLPPEAQQAVEQWHFADIDRQAERMGLNSYIGQTVAGIPITQDGIRAMAHLGGIGGAAKFLQSGGQYNPADSNGTSLADYALRHGGGSSAGITPIGGAGAPPATGVSPVVTALMQAQGNPWVQQKYGPVIQALMGQEMQRQNAAYEQQLRQQDPMYQLGLQRSQLELDAMRNPSPPKPVFEGGRWWDISGRQPQPLTDRAIDPTTLMQNLEAAGIMPGTPEYAQAIVDAVTKPQVALDNRTNPAPPSGYRNVYDEAGNLVSQEAIPGGPEDKSQQQGLKQGMADTAGDTVVTAADRALQAAQNRALGSFGQGIASNLPWTDSAEVQRQTDVLKAMASSENINAMRQASPTGGALGNASDADLKILRDKSGALDPSSPHFERDLADYTRTLLRTIHGPDAGDQIFRQTWKGQMPQSSTSTQGQPVRRRWTPDGGLQ